MRVEVVPEHICIFQVGARISFLSMYEERKQGRVSNEKYWRIVEDPVEIPFLRVEFGGHAARITSCIC